MSKPSIGFAFWKYDQFPFVLGGEFTEIDDQGRVKVPTYQGWFTPVKIYSVKAGRELLKTLGSLTRAHRNEINNVNISYKHRAKKILNMDSEAVE